MDTTSDNTVNIDSYEVELGEAIEQVLDQAYSVYGRKWVNDRLLKWLAVELGQ